MKIVLFFFLLMNNGDIMKDLWQLFFASPSLQSHTKKKRVLILGFNRQLGCKIAHYSTSMEEKGSTDSNSEDRCGREAAEWTDGGDK